MNFKMIVTADDYGMCHAVNRAIEACLDAGAMKATCIMPNMPDCTPAASLRENYPDASLGLHWNLTQGKPIVDPSKVSTLVGPDRLFLGLLPLRHRINRKQIDLDEVRAELTAQYQRCHDLIGPPDFWNTHENAHLSLPLFSLFVELGMQLGISAMRSNNRMLVAKHASPFVYNLRHPMFWLKGQVINLLSKRAMKQGMRMPDGLYQPMDYGAGKAHIEQSLKRSTSFLNGKTIECVIHPATSVDSQLFGNLTETRRLEYEVFSDASLAVRLKALGVEIISFANL